MDGLLRPLLPEVKVRITVDSENAIVACLNGYGLPVCAENERGESHRPQFFDDGNMWRAFRPCFLGLNGRLFDRLKITERQLDGIIVRLPGKRYTLPQNLIDSWTYLENLLLHLVFILSAAHPDRERFPHLMYPKFPHQFEYNVVHSSRNTLVDCTLDAVKAFKELSTLVTFILCLFLNRDEATCFERAFNILRAHNPPFPPQFLTDLADSHVCCLNTGYRVGTIINPYESQWGEWIDGFVRARVPVWVAFGIEPDWLAIPKDRTWRKFFPKPHVIDLVQRRAASYPNVVDIFWETNESSSQPHPNPVDIEQPCPEPFPTGEREASGQDFSNLVNYGSPGDTGTSDDTGLSDDPGSTVERGSGQHPHEHWEAYFVRRDEECERLRRNETPQERQQRDDWVKVAARGDRTKGKVFKWVEDRGFYRRVLLARTEIEFEWMNSTPYQRCFCREMNQFDICEQLPRYPPGQKSPPRDSADPLGFNADSDDEWDPRDEQELIADSVASPSTMDIDSLDSSSHSQVELAAEAVSTPLDPQSIEIALKVLAKLNLVKKSTAKEMANDPPTLSGVDTHLALRYGFTCGTNNWNPHVHTQDKNKVSATESAAMCTLFYSRLDDVQPAIRRAAHDFVNTVVNPNLRYDDLPATWDISPAAMDSTSLVLNLDVLSIYSKQTRKRSVYVISPGRKNADKCPWSIAVEDVLTVLQIYRSGYRTMDGIAKMLLEDALPFRTVLRRPFHRIPRPISAKFRSRGLGFRRKGFIPTMADYRDYESARRDVLESGFGRAILLRGGLISRIAREFVPYNEVLLGPMVGDEIVCDASDSDSFVDDDVTMQLLDIVCGVYFVETLSKPNEDTPEVQLLSYWPRYHTWMTSCRGGQPWGPFQENFFLKQQEKYENGSFDTLHNASTWAQNLRWKNNKSINVVSGARRLAEDYYNHSSRAR